MRLAYADPPYLGCSRFYPEHPDAARWDDVSAHHDLLAELERDFDGWAYSLSSTSLRAMLPGAPEDVRIASWMKSFAVFKRNVRIAYTWEPVLFRPGRLSSKDGAAVGRDHLIAPITLKRGTVGAKPEKFNRWILDLLGYVDGDEMVDLFPGTAGMIRAVRQGVLL